MCRRVLLRPALWKRGILIMARGGPPADHGRIVVPVSPHELKPVDALLLGCGDIGTAIARQLLAAGRSPLAVRRNIDALPAEIPALSLDYTDASAWQALCSVEAESIILTPTPPGRDAEAYRLGYLAPVERLLEFWRDAPPRFRI